MRQAFQSEQSEPGPAFWLAIFLVIWDSSERISAVLGLTWDRVDLRAGWIRFEAEHRKGATADSAVPIHADTIAALKAIKRRDGKVFRWPYSATYIYRKLGSIMGRAGLPNNRLYKFHVFRKCRQPLRSRGRECDGITWPQQPENHADVFRPSHMSCGLADRPALSPRRIMKCAVKTPDPRYLLENYPTFKAGEWSMFHHREPERQLIMIAVGVVILAALAVLRWAGCG